jgi:hypothetical protein
MITDAEQDALLQGEYAAAVVSASGHDLALNEGERFGS